MRPAALTSALLLAAATITPALPSIVLAQAALPPRAERAPGPSLDLAVEAAQQAIATCTANGYTTTALVSDSAGEPVALLSADGVYIGTQMIAASKVATVIRYGVASGVVAEKVKSDPALAEEVKADPKIQGFAWQGALPIVVGEEILGVIAVSGAPGGDKDEVCAQAGIDRIAGRLE